MPDGRSGRSEVASQCSAVWEESWPAQEDGRSTEIRHCLVVEGKTGRLLEPVPETWDSLRRKRPRYLSARLFPVALLAVGSTAAVAVPPVVAFAAAAVVVVVAAAAAGFVVAVVVVAAGFVVAAEFVAAVAFGVAEFAAVGVAAGCVVAAVQHLVMRFSDYYKL